MGEFEVTVNVDVEEEAFVSAIRKSDGAPVALVCAIDKDGGNYRVIPFAVMVEGNPYELFSDPTQEYASLRSSGKSLKDFISEHRQEIDDARRC